MYLPAFGVGQNHQRSGSQPLEWMGQNLQQGRITIAGTGCQHHWNTQSRAQIRRLASRLWIPLLLECRVYVDGVGEATRSRELSRPWRGLQRIARSPGALTARSDRNPLGMPWAVTAARGDAQPGEGAFCSSCHPCLGSIRELLGHTYEYAVILTYEVFFRK